MPVDPKILFHQHRDQKRDEEDAENRQRRSADSCQGGVQRKFSPYRQNILIFYARVSALLLLTRPRSLKAAVSRIPGPRLPLPRYRLVAAGEHFGALVEQVDERAFARRDAERWRETGSSGKALIDGLRAIRRIRRRCGPTPGSLRMRAPAFTSPRMRWARLSVAVRRDPDLIHFVEHQNLPRFRSAPMSASTSRTCAVCCGALGDEASTTCSSKRRFGDLFERGAESLHQRGGKIADESDRIAGQNFAARGQQSSGARWDRAWRTCARRASTPAPVSRLNSVDFPALVYPTSAMVASGTDWRWRRCVPRPPRTLSS